MNIFIVIYAIITTSAKAFSLSRTNLLLGKRSLMMASREISVRKASADEVAKVKSWPTWGCDVSKFNWSYDSTETSYVIKGKVTVTPTNGGSAVNIEAGDMVVFPEGLSCVWQVTEPILKHYNFS